MEGKTIISYRFILLIFTMLMLIPVTYMVFVFLRDSEDPFDKFIIYTVIISSSFGLLLSFFLLFAWPLYYRFSDDGFSVHYIVPIMGPLRFNFPDIEGLYYRKIGSEFKGPYNVVIKTRERTHQVFFVPLEALKEFRKKVSSKRIFEVSNTQYREIVKYNKIVTSGTLPKEIKKKSRFETKYIKDYRKFYRRMLIAGIILMAPGIVGFIGMQSDVGSFLLILSIIGVSIFFIGDVLFVIGLIKLITKNGRILPNFKEIRNQF
ncbi:MAG: hypothetical protein ACMUIE_05085 [Thermoplasmatota archaeon]